MLQPRQPGYPLPCRGRFRRDSPSRHRACGRSHDPKCVRASTGSLFSVPVIRAASHREILVWVQKQRARGVPVVVIGTDERGGEDIRLVEFAQPIVLVIGNDTMGMTAAWRESCDVLLRIPMVGSATSLNAATAGSIVLYEARQRRIDSGERQALLSDNSLDQCRVMQPAFRGPSWISWTGVRARLPRPWRAGRRKRQAAQLRQRSRRRRVDRRLCPRAISAQWRASR